MRTWYAYSKTLRGPWRFPEVSELLPPGREKIRQKYRYPRTTALCNRRVFTEMDWILQSWVSSNQWGLSGVKSSCWAPGSQQFLNGVQSAGGEGEASFPGNTSWPPWLHSPTAAYTFHVLTFYPVPYITHLYKFSNSHIHLVSL